MKKTFLFMILYLFFYNAEYIPVLAVKSFAFFVFGKQQIND